MVVFFIYLLTLGIGKVLVGGSARMYYYPIKLLMRLPKALYRMQPTAASHYEFAW